LGENVTKLKVKADIVKPVFAAVEQTKFPDCDRYRVVVFNKVQDGHIIIDGVDYILVASEQPSINGHHFRQFCAQKNAEHHAEQKRLRVQREEEQRQKQAAAQAAKNPQPNPQPQNKSQTKGRPARNKS